MAKFDTHETDLYILPADDAETLVITRFIESNTYRGIPWPANRWKWSYSDTEGQSWCGKRFIEVPLGSYFLDEIVKALKDEQAKTQPGVAEADSEPSSGDTDDPAS